MKITSKIFLVGTALVAISTTTVQAAAGDMDQMMLDGGRPYPHQQATGELLDNLAARLNTQRAVLNEVVYPALYKIGSAATDRLNQGYVNELRGRGDLTPDQRDRFRRLEEELAAIQILSNDFREGGA